MYVLPLHVNMISYYDINSDNDNTFVY